MSNNRTIQYASGDISVIVDGAYNVVNSSSTGDIVSKLGSTTSSTEVKVTDSSDTTIVSVKGDKTIHISASTTEGTDIVSATATISAMGYQTVLTYSLDQSKTYMIDVLAVGNNTGNTVYGSYKITTMLRYSGSWTIASGLVQVIEESNASMDAKASTSGDSLLIQVDQDSVTSTDWVVHAKIVYVHPT